jgi:hypothetical protein
MRRIVRRRKRKGVSRLGAAKGKQGPESKIKSEKKEESGEKEEEEDGGRK